MYESSGIAAHFVYTVLLLPSGPLILSTFSETSAIVKSDKAVVEESIVALLKQSVKTKKVKKTTD